MRHVALLLVALSGALLAATWIGYPAWLRLRARSRPRGLPGGAHAWWPSVTIVTVVRNAETSVRDLLQNLLALAYPADLRRIIVVSDGSTDFTDAVAATFEHRGVSVLRLLRPHGEDAERFARNWVDSEVVVLVDPATRFKSSALAALVAPCADPTVGVAYGREVDPDAGAADPRGSQFRRYEEELRELETRVFGTVSARGAAYAVRTPLYRWVPAGPSPDFGRVLAARENGRRAVYVRDAEYAVLRPHSVRADYARTVRAVARDVATLLLRPHLLNPRRYGAFAWMLLGHKLARWFSPWAALAAVAGLLVLAPTTGWARIVLVGAVSADLVSALSYLFPVPALRSVAGLPGRLTASAVALAHASVVALAAPGMRPARRGLH